MNMINISVEGGVPSPVEGACGALTIGNVGDNGATGVALDFSAWAEEYGAGAVTLGVRRKGDAAWYPVALTVTGAAAVWIVSNIDTAVYGIGEARFAYTVGEVEKRSAVFSFFVDRGLGAPEGTPPDPYEDWVERLEDLGAETLQNAQDAAASASKAQGYAGDAETAKNAAEAAQRAAEASRDAAAQSTEAAADSAANAATAKTAAETARDAAQQSAGAAADSATAAATAKTAAETARDAAQQSAGAAADSATAAATAKTAVEAARDAAQQSAEAAGDSATAAATAKAAAEAARDAAQQSAGAAADSASASAGSAADSASSAASSAATAAASAASAGNYASTAAEKASEAASSATAASASATSAQGSASNAESSATAASASATAAGAAQTAAETAASHYPQITDGYWYVWDVSTGAYVNTNVKAEGEDGAPGVPGQPGRDGAPGQPGRDGATGPAGKSAYESAQDGGYSGTEAQFNTDLAGVGNKQNKITAAGLLKGDGSGGVSAAVAGTDYVPPSDYAPDSKTAAMTQPVGKDTNGKLWTEPGGGGGGADVPLSVVNGKICITFEEVS